MAWWTAKAQSRCLPYVRCEMSLWMSKLQIYSDRTDENRQAEYGVTYIPLALAAGARLYSNCMAEKIDVKRKRAVGVSARLPSGTLHVQSKGSGVSRWCYQLPQLWLKSRLRMRINGWEEISTCTLLSLSAGIFNETINGHLGIPQSYYMMSFST